MLVKPLSFPLQRLDPYYETIFLLATRVGEDWIFFLSAVIALYSTGAEVYNSFFFFFYKLKIFVNKTKTSAENRGTERWWEHVRIIL